MRGGLQLEPCSCVAAELGYSRATDLAGGFAAWKANGLPIRPASMPEPGRPGMGHPKPADAD